MEVSGGVTEPGTTGKAARKPVEVNVLNMDIRGFAEPGVRISIQIYHFAIVVLNNWKKAKPTVA